MSAEQRVKILLSTMRKLIKEPISQISPEDLLLLNSVFTSNAKGDIPLIYITNLDCLSRALDVDKIRTELENEVNFINAMLQKHRTRMACR